MVCVLLVVFVSNNEADVRVKNGLFEMLCVRSCNSSFRRCLREENCYQRQVRRRKFPFGVSNICVVKRSKCIKSCLDDYKLLDDLTPF